MCKLWVVFLGLVGKLHQAKSREIKIDIKTNKNIVTHTLFLVETVEHVKHVIVLKYRKSNQYPIWNKNKNIYSFASLIHD
jgi:hypothetical protein